MQNSEPWHILWTTSPVFSFYSEAELNIDFLGVLSFSTIMARSADHSVLGYIVSFNLEALLLTLFLHYPYFLFDILSSLDTNNIDS